MRYLTTAVAFLAVVAMAVGLTFADWEIETVDTSLGYLSGHTSLALDSDDYAHISYVDAGDDFDLKYAHWNGSEWEIETVDSDGYIFGLTSIAIDSDDCPHIAYCDISSWDLKYAYWDPMSMPSQWRIFSVDTSGYVGWGPSIALDGDNYARISYIEFEGDPFVGDLKYALWNGSTWEISVVDSATNVNCQTSIALDSDDYPHISYYDAGNEDLKYVYWDPMSMPSHWRIFSIDTSGDVGYTNSIAIDSPGDYPHISYVDSTNGDLKYAYEDRQGWHISSVDTSGQVGDLSSIALDSSDYPHISYAKFDTQTWESDLKYAEWGGSSWSIEVVDSLDYVVDSTSIALDSDGNAHISYHDADNGAVKYAHWEDERGNTTTTVATPASIAITSIYPNPTSEMLTCQLFLTQAGPVELALYDLSGRLVTSRNLLPSELGEMEAELDVSDLTSGVYTLRASQGGVDASSRAIIVR